ncbi:hypothetical protein [Phenylobacterium kunshanense]|uniref:Uncharacterized protein n=1 Tax=Phenylobacterium kunshanense TaxID=1445034 RepID=A0A328BP24_9CAUL|nr:hypothetical protein [Phenylobacterium kunshanense]RAK69090.1 hypothetical protein DJ019_03535 [Phenylobacterium kunshanense]
MSDRPDGPEDDGGGFDVDDWSRLPAFTGRVATLDDVEARRAVFALADTRDPSPIDMDLPQPVIWWEEDGEQAAVAVQAEAHRGESAEEDGDEVVMEVLGLVLADGSTAVALLDDVDLVDDSDPTWRALVAAAIGDETADD